MTGLEGESYGQKTQTPHLMRINLIIVRQHFQESV
jgi:hypothetical protein